MQQQCDSPLPSSFVRHGQGGTSRCSPSPGPIVWFFHHSPAWQARASLMPTPAPQLGVASAALLTTTRPNLDACPTLLTLGRGWRLGESWLTPATPLASKENPGFWKRCFLLRTSRRSTFTSSLASLHRPPEGLLHGSLAGFHSLGPLIYTFGLESLFLSPLPLCHSSVPFIARQKPDYHTHTGLSAVSSPSSPLCHSFYSLAAPGQDTLTSSWSLFKFYQVAWCTFISYTYFGSSRTKQKKTTAGKFHHTRRSYHLCFLRREPDHPISS